MTGAQQQRIGIDCRLAGKNHAGIGRYIENLVIRAIKNKDFNWVLFFSNKEQAQQVLNLKDLQKLPTTVEIVFAPIRHYTLREQLQMPRIFSRAKLDLLHVPHFNIPLFYRGKMIVTIHDLLWHEQRGASVTTLPLEQYWLKYLAYKFIARMAVKKARKIIVPTKTVSQTLTNYYPSIRSKIIVTYEGVSELYRQTTTLSQQPKNRNLIYVGSLYPHKNLELVLRALLHLPNYKLIVVGSRTVFQDQTKKMAQKLGVARQVEFLGYLSDEQLKKQFQKSWALVFPSLSEGFGLPGIEAMSVGLPVLASDIPIFREVYDSGAIYFNPKSVEDFIDSTKILEKEYQKQKQIGNTIAKKYNWDTMVEQTVTAYAKVI